MINMKQMIEDVTLSKVCSFKPDIESDDSKQVTVNVKYDGLSLADVFAKALQSDIIRVQASLRKRFDQIRNGETINVNAKSPGASQVDPKQALIAQAKAEGVDVTSKMALMEWIDNQF